MGEVRRADRSDVPAIAATLSRAFADDPVATYVFPGAAEREDRLRRFFSLQLRHNYLPRGEVYTVTDRLGAALWLPPSPPASEVGDLLAHLSLVLILAGRLLAMRRLSVLLASHHPRRPHYYLGTIGTDPARQHRGVGSALLGPVLDRCDTDSVPAYLECSKLENVAFYRAHGFEVSEEVTAPLGGPPLWLMWRDVRASV